MSASRPPSTFLHADGLHSAARGVSLWQRKDGKLPAAEPCQSQWQNQGRKTHAHPQTCMPPPTSTYTVSCTVLYYCFCVDIPLYPNLIFPLFPWFCLYLERLHSSTPGSSTGPHPHHQPAASARGLGQRAHRGQCTNTHTHTHTHTHTPAELKLHEILNVLCVFCAPLVNNCHWSEREHCPIHRLSSWVHLCGGHSEAHDRWKPDHHGETLPVNSISCG